MNLIEKLKGSVTLKILGVLIITLLLLIPVEQVKSVINERESLNEKVQTEIYDKWGNPQQISGPILSVPYTEVLASGTPKEEVIRGVLHILPEALELSADLRASERHRGIYKALLYNTQVDFKGRFDMTEKDLPVDSENILWDEAEITVGVSDLRGIQNQVLLYSGEDRYLINPGINKGPSLGEGIHFKTGKMIRDFQFTIDLNGSESLFFAPLGKKTTVSAKGDWPSPSFQGEFLPENHSITKSDFSANWSILDINRSFPQIWKNKTPNIQTSAFGLNLTEGVNSYHKTLRAVKYAFMIISLIFTVFFFFEILKNLRIHPAQYTIVGISILVFYILLIAISEHLKFNLSYLISGTGILAINTFYFRFISGNWIHTGLFAAIFVSALGFIYILLNLEQYSLLVGSIGLFLITALVMFITRNVDWYAFNAIHRIEKEVELKS